MGKIFGIGLNKTGTLSLHEALTILGYRSLHWGGIEAYVAVSRAKREGLPLLTYIDGDYDAFSDIGSLIESFDLADQQYPGSRFILTTRDLDGWLDSRRRHVEKNQVRRAHGQYDGGFLEVDLPGWTDEYLAHHAAVRAYFADRPRDLLVVDITAGAGWEPLCRFLGRDIPDVAFPFENKYQPYRPGPGGAGPAGQRRVDA